MCKKRSIWHIICREQTSQFEKSCFRHTILTFQMWHLFITSKCIFEEKTLQCKETYWIKEKSFLLTLIFSDIFMAPSISRLQFNCTLQNVKKLKVWLAFLLSAKVNLRYLYVSHNFDIFRSGSLLQIISSIASLTGGRIVLSWIYELDGKVYKLWPKTFLLQQVRTFAEWAF